MNYIKFFSKLSFSCHLFVISATLVACSNANISLLTIFHQIKAKQSNKDMNNSNNNTPFFRFNIGNYIKDDLLLDEPSEESRRIKNTDNKLILHYKQKKPTIWCITISSTKSYIAILQRNKLTCYTNSCELISSQLLQSLPKSNQRHFYDRVLTWSHNDYILLLSPEDSLIEIFSKECLLISRVELSTQFDMKASEPCIHIFPYQSNHTMSDHLTVHLLFINGVIKTCSLKLSSPSSSSAIIMTVASTTNIQTTPSTGASAPIKSPSTVIEAAHYSTSTNRLIVSSYDTSDLTYAYSTASITLLTYSLTTNQWTPNQTVPTPRGPLVLYSALTSPPSSSSSVWTKSLNMLSSFTANKAVGPTKLIQSIVHIAVSSDLK